MSTRTLLVLDTPKKKAFTLLFTLTLVFTAAGAARSLLSGGRRAPVAAARPDVEAELITLGPDGFQPSELTRPKGRVYLVVDNMTDLPALDLRLSREAGHSLREVSVPRGQADWTELLDLTPGTYVLREAANPQWACRLVVTP